MTEKKTTVLIVDDIRTERYLISSRLEKWGYTVLQAESASAALEILKADDTVDLIISDQMMPDTDGIGLLRKIRKSDKEIPFIMLTAHGSIDKAVISMKEGADDYLIKPVKSKELRQVILRSLKFSQLKKENKELKNYLNNLYGFKNIIGKSPHMKKAVQLAAKAAEIPDMTVAVYGESGVGKELFARAIHIASGCLESRFVGVNCAGVPEGLMESELFGHVKGAFTGADKDREGKFGLAQHGTLLLDEIGDMSFDLQAKLLRVLQNGIYEKVGSDREITSNARIITATHRNLEEFVKTGKFREDLFHRINKFPITLPPLRDRKEDIPLLANYFIDRFRSRFGKPVPGISESASELLLNYHWPGNVRELKNCVERAIIVSSGELIRPEHLTLKRRVERAGSDLFEEDDKISLHMHFDPEKFSLDTVINRTLQMILEKCENNKAQAAELLKVNRNIFYRRKVG